MSDALKIGVIGGGSLFTPELVELFASNTGITGPVEIKLMDTDRERVRVVGGFCERILKRAGRPLTLTYADTYADAVKGSDFILIQFRVGGEKSRVGDDRLGLKYKIPFVETVTVCGLASFLRTYYQMEMIAELVGKYAPNAWVMNFSNPSGMLTEALYKLGCKKTVGICNGSLSLLEGLAKKLGAKPQDMFMNWRGLNHLTIVDYISYKGENVYDQVVEQLGEESDELTPFPKRLIQNLGFIPNPYLRFNYLKEEATDRLQKEEKTRAETVCEVNAELLDIYKDETLDTLPELLKRRGGFGYAYSVVNLIRGMVANERTIHYAQIPNISLFRDLPPDAFVEVPVLSMENEVRAIQVEDLPEVVKPLIISMKKYEQLLIDAAMNRSRRGMYNAMLANPLFGSDCLSKPLLEDVLSMNRAFLPEIN
ncbi:MAG: 6-phospho-beta-glucosidase [Oscillospiraceae bacterium]|nr:6-phospho-beta-glucosidase [Oscillospiraceae bacterium]